MYACEAMFGAEAGQQIHEMVERAIGRTCPCLRGESCPIAPGATPVMLTMPTMRQT